jgi:hypothetical protein
MSQLEMKLSEEGETHVSRELDRDMGSLRHVQIDAAFASVSIDGGESGSAAKQLDPRFSRSPSSSSLPISRLSRLNQKPK